MALTGSSETRLVVIRGNAASGKSSIAAGLRAAYGRGLAIVGQDNIRRNVLREHDLPGGANIGLIDSIARYALDHGYHVVVEGILHADRYAEMLTGLVADHQGVSRCFYLDVPFAVTLKRHATRPLGATIGEREMRQWWSPHDLIPANMEEVIDQNSTLEQSVCRILRVSGLDSDTGQSSRSSERESRVARTPTG